MKKLLYYLSVVLFASLSMNLQAQLFVGGSVGFNSSGNSETDRINRDFRIVPTIGYMMSESLVVGAGVGYSGSRAGQDGDNYTRTGEIILNPFVRLRTETDQNLGIYGELGFDVGLGSTRFISGDEKSDPARTTSIGAYVGPGLDYTLGDHFFITALWGALSYRSDSVKDVDGSNNSFGLNLNPSNINFGLNYMF